MIKKCSGCGSLLQNKDQQKIGYSPKENAKLCERCFKLKNYNQKEVIELKYNNDEIIDILNKKADVVFFITDFLNINQRVINIFKSLKKEKYLVINKIDYIPNSIKLEKYKDYLKNVYKVNENIICLSATKKYNLNELNNKLQLYKNCYFCGFTNSGKSAIINAICKMNNKNSTILESLMPNTTLDVIKLKISDSNYIYDTPGFILNNDFNANTFPKKYIKPVTIQVKENDIIKIGDNNYIYSNKPNSFTFYMSRDIKIEKKYNLDVKYINEFLINDNSDVIIDNYGFINIKNKCTIKTNINITEVRKSMFE